ncbi:hypothetical protein LPJ75_007280, partial [Coemansia sp. RSA 2598]
AMRISSTAASSCSHRIWWLLQNAISASSSLSRACSLDTTTATGLSRPLWKTTLASTLKSFAMKT